ncbi:hypothetical protein FEM48_Zijuj05G0026800 [Ziziphus jujuba var. spinosa]|uniref:Isopenicillin N synthase-like Fe(2+) 2OG dioxygenase domain-containing protein n=1 Tax=Ziziphus jujuba var. spinosa TaxID=714518 RepID=A0A978VCC4_ZIZJJ|nr:hypothetical protein FEM48_Zijuj05G0026800 [Ziziphus jujuba var. spinosa]
MFELPIEIKLRNTVDLPNRGYAIDKFQKMPLYEGMGIDNARFVEETQKFMNLMWPDGKDNFCSQLKGDLNDLVLEMVFESYGTGKHYASFAASNSHVIRFLTFIPQEDPEVTNIRLQPHKDLSFATIVHQVDVGGLEVEANDGSWIALQPEPSHFVFMACQAMQVSNVHLIKST